MNSMNRNIPGNWLKAVNEGDLNAIMECYDEKAILFATFESKPLTTTEEIRNYFVGFTAREGAGVRLEDGTLEFHDYGQEGYLATGFYEFYYLENGEEVCHPARFSFAVKIDQMQKIKHHHSSTIPLS